MNDAYQRLMETQAWHNGTLCRANRFSIGRNKGGVYIRFFHEKAKFSLAVVYENQFFMLKEAGLAWVGEKALEVGKKLKEKRAAVTELEELEDDQVYDLGGTAYLLRFKLDHTEEKARWYFNGVYKFQKDRPKEESARPPTVAPVASDPTKPPVFDSKASAIVWSVQQKVFGSEKEANLAYEGLRKEVNPKTASEMFSAWLGLCKKQEKQNERSKDRV